MSTWMGYRTGMAGEMDMVYLYPYGFDIHSDPGTSGEVGREDFAVLSSMDPDGVSRVFRNYRIAPDEVLEPSPMLFILRYDKRKSGQIKGFIFLMGIYDASPSVVPAGLEPYGPGEAW